MNETREVRFIALTVMAGLVWGFLSSWNFAFFRPPRCLAWGWREGRLPALRFLGKRDMSMAGPLSRSKPPEAGAEGQPLQGSSHRRPSAAEIAGTSSRRSIRLARRRNRGLALLTSPAFPRRFGWMWAIRDAHLPVARRRRASLTPLAPGIGRLARERGALAGGGFSCGRGWISRRS